MTVMLFTASVFLVVCCLCVPALAEQYCNYCQLNILLLFILVLVLWCVLRQFLPIFTY